MKSNVLWALATGLAVGFLVGREVGLRKSEPGGASAASQGASAPTTEVPKEWINEKDLGVPASFAELSPAQKHDVLRLMNEKACDCGCPHGSYAKCKKDDPGCPRAPKVLEQAIALAKSGKGYEAMAAAVKKPDNAPPAGPPPGAPQKVELAAWTPVKGPKLAKVTIVEFSDFQ
jgi:hypothetical protein